LVFKKNLPYFFSSTSQSSLGMFSYVIIFPNTITIFYSKLLTLDFNILTNVCLERVVFCTPIVRMGLEICITRLQMIKIETYIYEEIFFILKISLK
jgi:hypothetical protein